MFTNKLIVLSVLLGILLQSCAEEKSSFIAKLERGEQVKIVTLGTSLTGGTWRWVDVMEEWLNECYPGQVSIENLGVGASATMTVSAMKGNQYLWKQCGLDRIPEAIAINPDVVFIEFAVNDAYEPYGISLEQSQQNLESMISNLIEANPSVEIILQTMNVVLDLPELNQHESTDRINLFLYHEMYRDVAKQNQLLLIDHYPNWEKYLQNNGKEGYLKIVTDGVHPNLEGYRVVLLPELKRVLLKE